MLEHFFGSKTRLKLLKTFFRFPDKPFFVRELARIEEIQLNAIRREITNLEKIGLISAVTPDRSKLEEMGTERSKYYQLNTNCLLYPELNALLHKSEQLEEQQLVANLKDKGGDIKLFVLTGFFAGDSDISTDILLVGTLKPLIINKIIKNYEGISDHPVRFTLMDEHEFKDRREIGDKFLYGIFEAKHQVVVDEYRVIS